MELLLYLSRITIFDSPVYSGASVLNSNTHVNLKIFLTNCRQHNAKMDFAVPPFGLICLVNSTVSIIGGVVGIQTSVSLSIIDSHFSQLQGKVI